MYHKPICMKSLLLGMGAGIIMTGVIGLVYTMGTNPSEPTQEEIEAFAKKNNLVIQKVTAEKALLPDVVIEENTPTPKVVLSSEEAKETEDPKNTVAQVIEFRISAGQTSEKVASRLQQLNIIQNEEEFLKYLRRQRLEARLQIGNYNLHADMNHEELAKLLTRTAR